MSLKRTSHLGWYVSLFVRSSRCSTHDVNQTSKALVEFIDHGAVIESIPHHPQPMTLKDFHSEPSRGDVPITYSVSDAAYVCAGRTNHFIACVIAAGQPMYTRTTMNKGY